VTWGYGSLEELTAAGADAVIDVIPDLRTALA
jgi:phosphoglycolate phosphatase-like HAD superfamily hydrolase